MSSQICRLCLITEEPMNEISSQFNDTAEKYFYLTNKKLKLIEDCVEHMCEKCECLLELCYASVQEWRFVNKQLFNFIAKPQSSNTDENEKETSVEELEIFTVNLEMLPKSYDPLKVVDMSSKICRLCLTNEGNEISSCDTDDKYFYLTNEKLKLIGDCPKHMLCKKCESLLELCYASVLEWRFVNNRFLNLNAEQQSSNADDNKKETSVEELEISTDNLEIVPESHESSTNKIEVVQIEEMVCDSIIMYNDADIIDINNFTFKVTEDDEPKEDDPAECDDALETTELKLTEDDEPNEDNDTECDDALETTELKLTEDDEPNEDNDTECDDALEITEIKLTEDDEPNEDNPTECDDDLENVAETTELKLTEDDEPNEDNPTECDDALENVAETTELKLEECSMGPFKCKKCKRFYKEQWSFEVHKLTHTRKEKKPLESESDSNKKLEDKIDVVPQFCLVDDCDVRTTNLVHHLLSHTNGRRPFKCPICDKVCSRQTALRLHILAHTNEKPFKCNECYKSFRHPAHLINHQKLHLGLPRSVVCKICDVETTNLKEHNTQCHTRKRLNCPHCFRRFFYPTALQTHIRDNHTHKNLFVCHECGLTYRDKNTFTNHECTHILCERFSEQDCTCQKRDAEHG